MPANVIVGKEGVRGHQRPIHSIDASRESFKELRKNIAVFCLAR
jgi:hypothetical protein